MAIDLGYYQNTGLLWIWISMDISLALFARKRGRDKRRKTYGRKGREEMTRQGRKGRKKREGAG